MATQLAETRSLPLYAIAHELAELEELLIASEGVLDKEAEARLDALEGAFETKTERICGFRQNLLRSAEAYKAEEERLAKRRRSLEKSAESLRGYLYREMTNAERPKIETGTWRLRIQRSPATVTLRDGAEIPEEYKRVVVEFDRRAALEALKRERKVPDLPGEIEVNGMVVRRGSHLRIE